MENFQKNRDNSLKLPFLYIFFSIFFSSASSKLNKQPQYLIQYLDSQIKRGCLKKQPHCNPVIVLVEIPSLSMNI